MTQTKQHHSDLLQLQTNVEKTNTDKESSPLIEREQIANTPFWIIGNEEQGYNIIMGKWKISQQAWPTKTEALIWLDEDFYNIILSMIICVTTDINKLKQN